MSEVASSAAGKKEAADREDNAKPSHRADNPKRNGIWADTIVSLATVVIAGTGILAYTVSEKTLSEIEKSTNAANTSAQAALVASEAASEQAGVMRDTLAQMKLDSKSQSSQFASQLSVVKDQVTAASRMAEANERASFANRAWLSVKFSAIGEPKFFGERGVPDEQAAIRVEFLIQNHGLSPARVNSIETSLYVVPSKSVNAADGLKIDPDNPAHSQYNMGGPRNISASGEQISGIIVDYELDIIDEIRRTLSIAGNGDSSKIVAEFIFYPHPNLLYSDPSDDVVRFNYWLHVEVPYLDVYQVERRTCFFARVDGNTAYWADHISSERHDYQR